MSILNFLLLNWDSVLVVAVIIAGAVVLVIKKQYTILDQIIFALVTEAERQYGGDTGMLKLAAVIDWVYPKIPSVIRLFLTARLLEKIIDRVLTKAKERWKKNPTLAAYVGLSEAK